MNEADKSTRYPWGKASPGMRLRATAERASKGLEQARAPGLNKVQNRWTESVRAALPLVETLEHLSGVGFRGARNQQPVRGADVASATREVHDALGKFVQSSVFDLSEHFVSFATAVERLIALAKKAARSGVEGDPKAGANDPWEAFKPRKRSRE